jgi:hypothetical protein
MEKVVRIEIHLMFYDWLSLTVWQVREIACNWVHHQSDNSNNCNNCHCAACHQIQQFDGEGYSCSSCSQTIHHKRIACWVDHLSQGGSSSNQWNLVSWTTSTEYISILKGLCYFLWWLWTCWHTTINRQMLPSFQFLAIWLPIQGSSVPCKCIFSNASLTDDKQHGCLLPNNFSSIQTVKGKYKKEWRWQAVQIKAKWAAEKKRWTDDSVRKAQTLKSV